MLEDQDVHSHIDEDTANDFTEGDLRYESLINQKPWIEELPF